MQNTTREYELLNPEGFGEWLAATRREKGYSRRVLATLSDLDVTTICKYEIYGHSPSLTNYVRILEALGLMAVIKEIDDAEKG